jgi:hypothetical protein
MRFEISYRGGATHEVDLPGGVAALGRDPGCDVVLNDSKCSRRHAVVEDGPEGLVVRDSGSVNGVYLNGQRVETARLRPGDVLRLGDVRLKLLPDLGETVVVGPEDLQLNAAAGPPRTEPVDLALRTAPVAVPAPEAAGPGPARANAGETTGGPRRPATVTVLVALWSLFVPASVAFVVHTASRLDAGAPGWTLAALLGLVLAGLGTAMALGLLTLAPWARHLQVATAAVGLVVCPFTLAAATVLLYMTRPEVKAAFEGGPPAATAEGAAEATFALSLVAMLVLGLALTAIAVLLL